jgi:hypothetical protein
VTIKGAPSLNLESANCVAGELNTSPALQRQLAPVPLSQAECRGYFICGVKRSVL